MVIKKGQYHYLSIICLIIFVQLLSIINCSKYENDYIIESVTYNKEKTSVLVNIKYNK